MTKTYVVTADGELAGKWRRAGELVSMTAAEAKYLCPPLGTRLIEQAEQRTADHGKLDRRQRKRRNRSK